MDVAIGPVRVATVLGCTSGAAPVTGVTAGSRDSGDDVLVRLLVTSGVVGYRGRFLDQDRLSPHRGAVVPLTVRTDGVWAWSEASAYYLREHGVRPSEELLAHLLGHSDRPSPTYQDLDRIREECDDFAARAARTVRMGQYIVWRGREWRANATVPEVAGVLISYQHPMALAFGLDLAQRSPRRVVPRDEFSDSYQVFTEIQIRGEWVQTVGFRNDRYEVSIGDGKLAARLDVPMTEPGVWQKLFSVDEVDSIRETRRLRYDHPKWRSPATGDRQSDRE